MTLTMQELFTPPTVVVGIDGSRAAIRAALWAVDEAVSRDIPLRLLYALDPRETKRADPDDVARKLATAEIAVRYAFTAVEATTKPVKIEVEIAHGQPITTLLRASGSAAMVCLGAIGLRHFQTGRVGSTARAVATSARCPVAIVRWHDGPTSPHTGWIVVEMDACPSNGVALETAFEEARLRRAPLRVLSRGNQPTRADLDSRLARWTRRDADVDVQQVVVHDGFLAGFQAGIVGYLAKNAGSVQLVVMSARARDRVGQLLGPAGNAAMHQSDCSVLVVDHEHL